MEEPALNLDFVGLLPIVEWGLGCWLCESVLGFATGALGLDSEPTKLGLTSGDLSNVECLTCENVIICLYIPLRN